MALAGGVALQVYGSQRLTVDVDIVASGPIRGLRRASPLSFGGYSSTTTAGTVVDVMICSNEYEAVFDAALDKAKRLRDIPIRVVRPEHLVVMKMLASRGKDDVDLAWLITSGAVELPKATSAARKLLGHYAANELALFAEEAIWLKSRGRE